MTEAEREAIKQRTREQWAKVQQAARPCTDTFQHFASDAERKEHNKQVADAIARGEIPF